MKHFGLLGYFNLSDWFDSSFSKSERNLMRDNFQAIGIRYSDLIEGDSKMPSNSSVWLLTTVAGNFIRKKEMQNICVKFLIKAESMIDQKKSYSDLHFLYLIFNKVYKAQKNTNKVLEYSKKMIAISEYVNNEFIKQFGKNDVAHQGFIDYLDFLEETNNENEILKIEEKARRENWKGPWNRYS